MQSQSDLSHPRGAGREAWGTPAWGPLLGFVAALAWTGGVRGQTIADLSGYSPDCEVRVTQDGHKLHVDWPLADEETGQVVLDLSGEQPLIELIGVRGRRHETLAIVERANPEYYLTVGTREIPPGKPADQQWQVFFDNPHRRPHEVHVSKLSMQNVKVAGSGSRATVTIEPLTIGPFAGALELTFFAGSPLMRIDAAVATEQDRLAILYDAGLVTEGPPSWDHFAWIDTAGERKQISTSDRRRSGQPKVRHRTIVAAGNGAAVACFPPPHQFQFPRDYTDNLGFVWFGSGYQGQETKTGFGIRQNKDGGGNFVPWFDGPPGVTHRMGMFLLLARGNADEALKRTLRYTHGDRFPELEGYKTLASHFHMAIAVTAMQERERGNERREPPDYVGMFKDMGVNLVHLAEFHGDGHPQDPGPLRLPEMESMFRECRRWSDDDFLLMPGEEANVYLGLPQPGKHAGHWLYLFPREVYWTMTRAPDQPFVEEHPQYGKVYHVGSRGDMIRLLKEERGLAWTAHPRIKASSWTPDIFRNEDFFLAEFWLGGAWKAMPADLSRPKQGERVLDLLDDMANWGQKKYVLGEVDVFKLDPTHELYGHMNVNYVQLDRVPSYGDGWQSVLDALSGGQFFVTTGEVLIPRFTVGGKPSGDVLKRSENEQPELMAELRWTFPLAFAEVISGDGQQVYRERIDLSDTKSFGTRTLTLQPELAGRHWVRLEVWDVAANGAFTQPVWIE